MAKRTHFDADSLCDVNEIIADVESDGELESEDEVDESSDETSEEEGESDASDESGESVVAGARPRVNNAVDVGGTGEDCVDDAPTDDEDRVDAPADDVEDRVYDAPTDVEDRVYDAPTDVEDRVDVDDAGSGAGSGAGVGPGLGPGVGPGVVGVDAVGGVGAIGGSGGGRAVESVDARVGGDGAKAVAVRCFYGRVGSGEGAGVDDGVGREAVGELNGNSGVRNDEEIDDHALNDEEMDVAVVKVEKMDGPIMSDEELDVHVTARTFGVQVDADGSTSAVVVTKKCKRSVSDTTGDPAATVTTRRGRPRKARDSAAAAAAAAAVADAADAAARHVRPPKGVALPAGAAAPVGGTATARRGRPRKVVAASVDAAGAADSVDAAAPAGAAASTSAAGRPPEGVPVPAGGTATTRRGRPRKGVAASVDAAVPVDAAAPAGAAGTGRRGKTKQTPEERNVAAGWVWEDPEGDYQPRINDFDNSSSGVNHTLLPRDCSVLESFKTFYGADFFEMLMTESNRYASTSVFPTPEIRKKRGWRNITLTDFYRFFAVVFHMMLVKKPKLRDYFVTDSIMFNPFPRDIGMGRDRWFDILRCLHVSNNANLIRAGQPGYDRGFKIRPMFDYVLKKVQSLYTPKRNLTLDEAMCPWRGRLSWRVYIKNKPTKYGIRIEMVCESETGIVLNMEMYTGKGKTEKSNKVEELVVRMLAPFINKNHWVFMDRRYSSVSLFQILLGLGFYPVGTVMSNRKFLPLPFKGTKANKLEKGAKVTKVCNGVLATRWKDKRDVYMLSTVDTDRMVDVADQRERDLEVERLKPVTVVTYNSNKAGVDKHDQMAAYYPFGRKTLKWWKKLFFHLFELGLVNIHKMYNLSNAAECRMPLVDYIRVLGQEIVPLLHLQERPPVPAAAAVSTKKRPGNHYPVYIPSTATKERPTRVCVQCSNKELPDGTRSKRRESTYQCYECKVALCVLCFMPYHRDVKHPNV